MSFTELWKGLKDYFKVETKALWVRDFVSQNPFLILAGIPLNILGGVIKQTNDVSGYLVMGKLVKTNWYIINGAIRSSIMLDFVTKLSYNYL